MNEEEEEEEDEEEQEQEQKEGCIHLHIRVLSSDEGNDSSENAPCSGRQSHGVGDRLPWQHRHHLTARHERQVRLHLHSVKLHCQFIFTKFYKCNVSHAVNTCSSKAASVLTQGSEIHKKLIACCLC